MLDLRVYRAAFLPALVAVFVLAFSLTDQPRPRTTRLAPLAFDDRRAFQTMEDLADRFPQRRPGSANDTALADRVEDEFERTGFAKAAGVDRTAFDARTVDGKVTLETVTASREGLSDRSVLVIAHRDAAGVGAEAELSGTAALLELARLFADRDLAKTITLASVSGGSGGFAGARQAVANADGRVDAVIVLGDLASERVRRPFVVPWRTGPGALPLALERTAQRGLREEIDADPGHGRAAVQLLRRALPLSSSEQAGLGGAVLISASSERTPAAGAAVDATRLRTFGRGVLRTLYAALESPERNAFPAADGVVVAKRLIPTWSIRLLVLALLAPALLTAFDGFFRARRRGAPMLAWSLWALGFAVPILLAWGWARVMGVVGAVDVVGSPDLSPVSQIGPADWAVVASTVLVLAGGLLLRPRLTHLHGPKLAEGGAAAATGLLLATVVLGVWLVNPYAAAVLLPAAHAWLLVTASDGRVRRSAALLALVAGLLGPALLVLYYVLTFGVSPLGAVWTAFGLVAGGVLGIGALLTVAGVGAGLGATMSILRIRRGLADTTKNDNRPVTRGPRSYAGPGSLGGTESALRR